MDIKLSKEFVLVYAGEVIARCIDFEFMVNGKRIDTLNLDSGKWDEFLKDIRSWKITFNALVNRTGNNYQAMLADLKESETPATVITGERKSGGAVESGEAYIMELRSRYQAGEKAVYSGTIEGTGPLQSGTMPAFNADFLTYSFTEETGAATINDTAKTVDIEVANGTDLTTLVATFTTSPSVQKVLIGTKYQESGVTENDFSEPVTYTIYAADNETKEDWVVTVTEEVV
jgi:hypothetical protein